MRRSKSEPLNPVDLVHRFEQLHKWAFSVALWKLVPAIQIHDLTEQREFLHSARQQVAPLAHDFIDRTAALRSARLRDNAEGAMHVASLHDRDKSARLPRGKRLLANCLLRAGLLGDINDRESRIVHRAIRQRDWQLRPGILSHDDFFDIIGHAMEFLRSDHKIDMRQILQQRLAARLRHAAEETEDNVWPLFRNAPQ